VGGDNGRAVMVFKDRTMSSYPQYSYISWYQRADDNWWFNPADDYNYKTFDFSNGSTPYTNNESSPGVSNPYDSNWYTAYASLELSSRTAGVDYAMNDDGASLQNPDANGHSMANWWLGAATNPMGGTWAKVEMEIVYTNTTSGYIKLWENGALKIDYAGSTDKNIGTTRNEGIGGYARDRSINNWRYFADIYLDYSRQRVLIGNAATLAGSTTFREVQVPSVWSNTSITVTVNQGAFANSANAYLYVFDATGTANATGYPITFGSSGGGDTTPPNVPSGLSVN